MTITTFVVYLMLVGLIYTVDGVAKVKKENEKLREEIEIIKKHISKE